MSQSITYQDSLDGVTADMLEHFFQGWKSPLRPEQHLRILTSSSQVILALDTETNKVVGFVNALSDGLQAAFISMLEVTPAYKNQGIGTQLMRRMLDKLISVNAVDLTCDPDLQPFYERFGLQKSVGMLKRNY